MCGICGDIALRGAEPPREAVVRAMAGALRHRGPDAEGVHVDACAALANRRLSIIDVAGGAQPIYSEDGAMCVVFNGEIYNQQALRTELQADGHRFRSRTDTEVLVHLHEQHGPQACERLNGMFAYALWDIRAAQLLLVRDRLGIKPLYYWTGGDRLIFASEIKALLQHPAVPRELDPDGLDLFLALRYLPARHTLFRGIRKLLPGTRLYVDGATGRLREECYWSPEGIVTQSQESASADALADEIQMLLSEAVQARLMSDVPFGAFLSGGLDSSGVVGLMAQELGAGVQTFAIGFSEERRLDERSFARQVAARWKTDHREVDCTAAKVEVLPRLIHHFDAPFADPIIVPTYQVAELAAQHVKVVLTGEGADELFGGYSRFVSERHLRSLARLPRGLLAAARSAALLIPVAGVKTQLRRALAMAAMDEGARLLEWVVAFGEDERRQLYGTELRPHVGQAARQLYGDAVGRVDDWDPVNRMLFADLRIRLPECMLARTDRMTMAVSLEGRTPFLDHLLVERVLQLPGRCKVRGSEEKVLLKRALARVLPETVVGRRKQGLAVPFAQWTRYGIEAHIRRILDPQRVAARGLFQPAYVERLLGRWGAHAARHSQLIWSLLCLELWCRLYLDGDLDPDTPLAEV